MSLCVEIASSRVRMDSDALGYGRVDSGTLSRVRVPSERRPPPPSDTSVRGGASGEPASSSVGGSASATARVCAAAKSRAKLT